MPAPRLIFYNTARDDGGVDEFDEGTWKYFSFKEQSLAALHRRLAEETRRQDFVVCRSPRERPGAVPRRPGPPSRQQPDGVRPRPGVLSCSGSLADGIVYDDCGPGPTVCTPFVRNYSSKK
ncbi:uncharacterized protein LOC119309287 [Triticum dicoccoides]|uniref:uncharacterized protein LOC119309287 n=1 Tax=Triticum dicoccoides TaxID=85692 RepID=UPI00188F8D03|nr:uncharacterized protein LOC119309287 [Triticum dicoccoides]